MARVSVMIWNVQNFGANTETYANYKGGASALLAGFIKGIVRTYGIDILVVLEVMKDAQQSLDSLTFALNDGLQTKDWCYDWIKGAVKDSAAVTPEDKVEKSDKLEWKSSKYAWRAEGYAVFWRNSQTGRFTMQGATRNQSEGSRKHPAYTGHPPPHAIELSLTGRDASTSTGQVGIQADDGFDPKQPAKTEWVWSEYPDVSTFAAKKPSWNRSRRPATFQIDLNIGGGDLKAAVPVIGFHAPSKPPLARMGTYLSGLAEELYAVGGAYHEKVVAGGDFNVDTRTDGDWKETYAPYWSDFNLAWSGGAHCAGLNTDKAWRQTTIALREPAANGKRTGPPIVTDNLADYYHRTIDNVFHRGFTNAFAYTLLIPNMLMQGGDLGALMQPWYQPLADISMNADGVDDDWGPWMWVRVPPRPFEQQIFPSMTKWKEFLAGVQQGYFTGDAKTGIGDARNASVFTHDFVSDHLPVVVEFDVA
jgi:hypothetical protein